MKLLRSLTFGMGISFLAFSSIVLFFGLYPPTNDAFLFWMVLMFFGVLFVVVEIDNCLIEYLNNLHNKL